MYEENLVEFQIDKVSDTGSINLAAIPGQEGIDCGPFDIMIKQGASLLSQESANSNKFTISAEFMTTSGPRDVQIDIYSTSYTNIWTTIKGKIMV